MITAFLSAGVITRNKFKDVACASAFFMLVGVYDTTRTDIQLHAP